MRMPFEPEPEAALQARYPVVLDTVYRDVASVQRACEQRPHVFDFADGLRMIVTRESLSESEIGLLGKVWSGIHISASLELGFALHQTYLQMQASSAVDLPVVVRWFNEEVLTHWRRLVRPHEVATGQLTPGADPELIGLSATLVPHFMVWEP